MGSARVQDDQSAAAAAVPFRIRVGITGHRAVDAEQALALLETMDQVLAAIGELVSGSPRTPVVLSMISPLAEGADRVAARAALRVPGTHLEAPIPFPAEDYERDFGPEGSDSEPTESQREFRAFLAAADSTLVLGTRDDGYRPVGWYVVDRADILVAIWDGEAPRGLGGTAEIVRRAVDNNVPVVWVPLRSPERWADYIPAGDTGVAPEPSDVRFGSAPATLLVAALRSEYQKIDRYNAKLVELRTLDGDETTLGRVESADPEAWIDTWAADAIRAADSLAMEYQARYRLLIRATFVLAFIAAAAITAQAAFAGASGIDPLPWHPSKSFELHFPWLGLVEVISLGALAVTVFLARRRDTHRCYLEYRFLAERLRAAPYLAAVGAESRDVRPSILNADFIVYRSEGWPWRAFDEIWSRRRHAVLAAADVESLRAVIADRWIREVGPERGTDRSQYGYHQRAHIRERRTDRRLSRWVGALFVLTGASAIVHLWLEVVHYQAHEAGFTWPHTALFLSFTLAAGGAALSGYLAQRGHRKHAAHSLRMLTYLAIDNERVRAARSPDGLRRAVEDTHRHILTENRLWFEGLSYEEVELHT